MDRKEIFDKVLEIFIDYDDSLKDMDINEETPLIDGDLMFDSLALHDISFDIEDKFNVLITDNDLSTFIKFGNIVDFLERSI